MQTRHLRFDIPMLADRLIDIASWLGREPQTKHLKIGWFGASTGAGAALIAAARRPENIVAVVSRGGRPDLAGDDLSKVIAPVLLIVGENDPQVIDLNEWALSPPQRPVKAGNCAGRDTLIRRARYPGIGCAPGGHLVAGSRRLMTEALAEKSYP